jgi:1,4-alpha-glucan branching enzyme
MEYHISPYVDNQKKTIEFHLHVGGARQVSLAGTFNGWEKNEFQLEPVNEEFWKVEIPIPPKGKYHYKFCIDDQMWMEDFENPQRELDGTNGWNSVLTV